VGKKIHHRIRLGQPRPQPPREHPRTGLPQAVWVFRDTGSVFPQSSGPFLPGFFLRRGNKKATRGPGQTPSPHRQKILASPEGHHPHRSWPLLGFPALPRVLLEAEWFGSLFPGPGPGARTQGPGQKQAVFFGPLGYRQNSFPTPRPTPAPHPNWDRLPKAENSAPGGESWCGVAAATASGLWGPGGKPRSRELNKRQLGFSNWLWGETSLPEKRAWGPFPNLPRCPTRLQKGRKMFLGPRKKSGGPQGGGFPGLNGAALTAGRKFFSPFFFVSFFFPQSPPRRPSRKGPKWVGPPGPWEGIAAFGRSPALGRPAPRHFQINPPFGVANIGWKASKVTPARPGLVSNRENCSPPFQPSPTVGGGGGAGKWPNSPTAPLARPSGAPPAGEFGPLGGLRMVAPTPQPKKFFGAGRFFFRAGMPRAGRAPIRPPWIWPAPWGALARAQPRNLCLELPSSAKPAHPSSSPRATCRPSHGKPGRRELLVRGPRSSEPQ